MAMLIGETPRMSDVRRRFLRHGWTVVQAWGHVRGIRRRLFLESSTDLVLVVSTHSAVHRRYGRALSSMLEYRSAFPALRMTIVLLDEESAPGDAGVSLERFRRFGESASIGLSSSRFAAQGSSSVGCSGEVLAYQVPCDLRAFTPEEVVRYAVAEIDSPRLREASAGGMLVAGDAAPVDWPGG